MVTKKNPAPRRKAAARARPATRVVAERTPERGGEKPYEFGTSVRRRPA
jgi:hypothetical protein